ncbi:MAG: site-specific DNA-methyltransferase [Acidimicrobiia bacterium]
MPNQQARNGTESANIAAPLCQPNQSTSYLNSPTPGSVKHLLDTKQNVVLVGNAEAMLRSLPSGSAQMAVTSPPYWSLRDYQTDGQIGRDENLDEYLKSLVRIFDEVGRILSSNGTLWVNIGDSYTSGNRTWRAPDPKNSARAMAMRPPNPEGTKNKDLIGIPWRFALAMQDAGWYVRSDIIWYKPNCQPESVRDRPTRSHEHIFLFSKNERYYYDVTAVTGPNGRRLRDVWDINTVGYPGAHFATFPPELVRRCIALGSQRDDLVLDPFLGSGTTGKIAIDMGRRFAGTEVNPDYIPLIRERIAKNPQSADQALFTITHETAV